VWRDDCAALNQPDRLRLDIGYPQDTKGDTIVEARIATSLRRSCHGAGGGYADVALLGIHPTVSETGAVDNLLATISAPAQSTHGQPLSFTVTLTNASDTAVSIRPCPQYVVEAVPANGDRPHGLSQQQVLRCTDAPEAVRSGESIVLDVQIDTAGLTVGAQQLSWQWADRQGASPNLASVVLE
jgi:hypothetical protein